MTFRRCFAIVLGLLVIMGFLVACGSSTKTDVRVRIIIREILVEDQSIRGADNKGEEWVFQVSPETVIEGSKGTMTLADLKVSDLVTIKANESASKPGTYDAVEIDVGVLK